MYERISEVTARQAQIEGKVITLEGEAIASPGDWIATDDRGNSWPVPRDEFGDVHEQISMSS